MLESDQHNVVAFLLDEAGLDVDGFVLEPCDVGGNNRVSAVRTSSGIYLAKWYFTSSDDIRDRLASEWRFLNYAKKIGIDCVPSPLAADKKNHAALYDFIAGDKIKPGQVSGEDVEQAANFFREINAAAQNEGRDLPSASEACFSIDAHVALLDGRLERLDGIDGDEDIDLKARDFVKVLRADWERLKDNIRGRAERLGLDTGRELDFQERCISPSDFGFHNAIKVSDGRLFFIDFEYAGWDDPAKMSGDFFFQPQIPVGEEHYERFLTKITAALADPDIARLRANLLRPIFGIKWCCIMLNAFIPEWSRRRTFADPARELTDMKVRQLAKAELAYHTLEPICARLGA